MHSFRLAYRPARGWSLGAGLLMVASGASGCAVLQGQGGKGDVPDAPKCPATVGEIASANFGLSADVERKVKAALSASANISSLASKVEVDVATACGGIARDLGASSADLEPKASGPGEKAKAACAAASAAIGDIKDKAGGAFTVKSTEPTCRAPLDAYADCAGKCDGNLAPGSVEMECEEGHLSGTCDGKCKGTCTVKAAGKCRGSCSGTCSGSCDAEFSGKCGGRCEGMCDGQDVKGKCKGVCDGKCTSQAEGKCLGKCSGDCSASCTVDAKGRCEGECSGSCDVDMKAPRCDSVVVPPEMSSDCRASCDADASARLECSPAAVSVVLYGVNDAEAAAKFRAALERHGPGLVKVSVGMKDAMSQAVAGVDSTIDGVKGTVTGTSEAQLKAAACLARAVTAQAQASATISVSVEASASAAGEISTTGGT